jgi:hypothetical protein
MDLPAVPETSDLIPPAAVVQRRLAEAIRAERALRRLLRVAVREEQSRQCAPQVDQKGGDSAA